jgi:hypothetical protein
MLTLLLGSVSVLPEQSLGSIAAPKDGIVRVVGPARNGSFGVFVSDMGRPSKFYRWDASLNTFLFTEGAECPAYLSGSTEYVATVHPEGSRADEMRRWRTEIIDMSTGKVIAKFDRQPIAQAGCVFTFPRLYRRGGHDPGFVFDAKSSSKLNIGSDETPSQVIWDTPKRRLSFSFGQESGNYIEEYAPATDRLLRRVKVSNLATGFGRLLGDPDFGPFAVTQEFIGVGIESVTSSYFSKDLKIMGTLSMNYVEKGRTGKAPQSWWMNMKSKDGVGVGYEVIRNGNELLDFVFVAVNDRGRILWRKRGLKNCVQHFVGPYVLAISPSAIAVFEAKSGRQVKRIGHPARSTFQFAREKSVVYCRKTGDHIEFFSIAIP